MQIPIVISPDFTKFSVLKEAVSEVNEIQTAFELSIVKQEWVPDTAKKTSIDSSLIFSMASKEMTESRICVVVQRRVNVDWFSDYRPHAYLISTSDWDAKYAPPSLRVYLIF